MKIAAALAALLASSADARMLRKDPDACEISFSGLQSGLCELFEDSPNCAKNANLKARIDGDGVVTGRFSDVAGKVVGAGIGVSFGVPLDAEVNGMASGTFDCVNIYEDAAGDTVALLSGPLPRCKICWRGATNPIDDKVYEACNYDCGFFDNFAIAVKKLASDGTIQHTSWAGSVGLVPCNDERRAIDFGLGIDPPGFPQINVAANPFADAGNQNSAKFTCEANE